MRLGYEAFRGTRELEAPSLGFRDAVVRRESWEVFSVGVLRARQGVWEVKPESFERRAE